MPGSNPAFYTSNLKRDANNRIDLALNGATVLADVAYDEQSRRDSVAYGNGTNVLYTFSPRGDLEQHDHYFTAAAVNYGFTYNGVGQMRTKSVSDPSYGWVAPSTGTTVYDVNGLNQYTDIDGVAPVHDLNGNLATDHLGRSFIYDAENVLRAVTGLTGGNASYRYHADGTRREKSHNGSTRTYYHMGGLGYLDEGDTAFAADQEIAEYSGGTLLKRFIRLPGSIDEAFLMIDVPTGSQTWAHTDRLGSVIATTDSTGTVADKYRYSPYGKPGSEGVGGFPFRFTGQRLDAESGLYYYKARYYDPEVGRFLQTDPIGYDDQMNLYAYVGNDPVNLVDPNGLVKRDKDGKVIFTPRGKAVVVGHPGAPGTPFKVQPGTIQADDGRTIDAYRNESGDARMDCDCHGVTFADGDLWINNDQVEDLLEGDGYEEVSTPEVGDATIYRDSWGNVVHSATVVSVDPETGEVKVEGLGGLETETHIDSATPGPDGAWKDPTASVEFFRKPDE